MNHSIKPILIPFLLFTLLQSCSNCTGINRDSLGNDISINHELTGTIWVLVSPPLNSGHDEISELTLIFEGISRISGWTGCNQLIAKIELITADSMRFEAIGSTQRGCEYPEMEGTYLRMLAYVKMYELRNEQLFLYWHDGERGGRLYFVSERSG